MTCSLLLYDHSEFLSDMEPSLSLIPFVLSSVILKAIFLSSGGLQKERTPWPKDQMYTTFVLFKENVETVEAINQIAWKARCEGCGGGAVSGCKA